MKKKLSPKIEIFARACAVVFSQFSRKIMKISPRSQRITEKTTYCASDRFPFNFILVAAQPESRMRRSDFFEISEKIDFFTYRSVLYFVVIYTKGKIHF